VSVYFITAREVGRVKIGCAYDPFRRNADLQAGSPCNLTLEAVLKGGHAEERQLHRLFDEERVRGEWFVITEEIERAIAANPAPKRLSEQAMRELMPHKPPRNPEERDELREIKRRLRSGDIHFPFRALPVPNDSQERAA
jgi:hypothetical protein